MKTFNIAEKQNLNSIRQGKEIKAKSLKEAKRKASSMKCFCGTILTIEENESLISYKENGKWINI